MRKIQHLSIIADYGSINSFGQEIIVSQEFENGQASAMVLDEWRILTRDERAALIDEVEAFAIHLKIENEV